MYIVAIDLGGTNIAAAVLDEKFNILLKDSTPTLLNRPYEEIADDIGKLILSLISKAGISADEVLRIGIGAPGIPNNQTGLISDNANFHWQNFPLRAHIQKFLNKPVYMANDANAAARAEFTLGSGKGSNNFLMLTLGTGVGGGIVIDKKLYVGSRFIAGEIGHYPLKAGGRKCGCGSEGCIEQYCSATALVKRASELLAEYPDSTLNKTQKITAKSVVDAARENDALGKKVFDEYVCDLGYTLAGLVNMFDPDVIALGGGVAGAGEFLLEPLRKFFITKTIHSTLVDTKIVCAQMGNDAGIIGAALLDQ